MDPNFRSLASSEEYQKVSEITARLRKHRKLMSSRDFSNGYLIAEILSKYHPLEVQMHSYYSGTGHAAKRNNWGLLGRVFKVHTPVRERQIMFSLKLIYSMGTTESENPSDF